LAAFKQLPRVRVLFDNGAGSQVGASSNPGDPYPAFEHGFSSLPVPGTTARTWYFGSSGALGGQPPANSAVHWFRAKADALPPTDFGTNTGGGGLWGNASQWDWKWQQNPAGTAVSYLSAPLTTNTTVVGAGSVNLWVRSSTPDVDLQATISEVRPDGNESFVQNGWLRSSDPKPDPGQNNLLRQKSTPLEPVLSMRAADAQPMPQGQFADVVIPLYFQGHAYRAGSRIRITIAAPNGTQPVWSFGQTVPTGTATVSIASSRSMPSSLVL